MEILNKPKDETVKEENVRVKEVETKPEEPQTFDWDNPATKKAVLTYIQNLEKEVRTLRDNRMLARLGFLFELIKMGSFPKTVLEKAEAEVVEALYPTKTQQTENSK